MKYSHLLLLLPLSVSLTAQAEESATEQQMETVTVTADQLGTTTEGTDSYTTGAMSTATGLDLSIKETPQSVSVVTSERIKDQSMKTVADALQYTTGVSVKPVDRGRNNISVRGFDVTNYQLDGIPVTTGNVGLETSSTVLYDRVEVVRGATGLLSGSGEPSATINMVRKHADSKTFTGTASVEVGSWDHRLATVDLTTPLTEDGSIRARFVVSGSAQNAFIDLESTDNSVFYAVVDADLGEKTVLSVGASEQRDDRDGIMWAGLPYWFADGGRTDWNQSKTTAAKWNKWDTTQTNIFANLKHELDNGWVLRADANRNLQTEDSRMLWLYGYSDRNTGLGMDDDAYHYGGEPEENNLNLIATGPFKAWGLEHELTTGLTYSKEQGGWTDRQPLTNPPTGNFNIWNGTSPMPLFGAKYLASYATTTQEAFYSAARLQLTEDLKLILGGRISNWEYQDDLAYWTPKPYTVKEDHNFTPYAGLVYDITEQYSAYASYTEIFNPQPFYQDRTGNYLDPLEGKNIETGIKGAFFDNTLNTSAAIFYIDQDNYAVADPGFFVPGTGNPASKASQGVKTKGYELEVSGALSEQWEVSAGWTQFSARDADDVDVAVDHPRKMLKLFTKYELAGDWNGFSVGGGMNWESSKPARDINPGTGYIQNVGMGSYATVDAMASYDVSKQLTLQMNVNNIFDKEYTYGSYWWGSPYTYGEPRNVMFTLDYTF